MARPIVYGPAGSTYVWSVRLALAEKGVTHELVPVADGEHQQEPHLSRHPFAKLPAFEHDGFAMYETQAILRYIDEGFASAPLQPTELHEFARMNQIIGIVDAYAWPSIAAGILFNRMLAPRLGLPVDEAAIAAALPRAKLCVSEIARLMGDQQFLAGDRVSLADLMVIPLLFYFARVPEGEAPLAEHPGLQAWMKRMEGRQSFQVTKPPESDPKLRDIVRRSRESRAHNLPRLTPPKGAAPCSNRTSSSPPNMASARPLPSARTAPVPIPASSSTWTRRASARSCATWRGASRSMGISACCPTCTTGSARCALTWHGGTTSMAPVFLQAMASLTNAKVMDDTGGWIGWMDAQEKCAPGPMGCVGYCMSGMHITNAAALYPHRIASAASLYGVGIITDKEDSPHLLLDRVKGELYYAFAETDRSVPAHIPGELKTLLDQHKIKHELKIFAGTEHGFAFPERAIYNTLAAEETWDKMFAMWDRTLKGK